MAQTREEKIVKMFEEMKEEALSQRNIYEERWNGEVSIRIQVRDGGIFGDVSVTKHGSKKKV